MPAITPPTPDQAFISMVIRVVSVASRRAKPISHPYYPMLQDFYESWYHPLMGPETLPSRENLTQILNYEASKLETMISNNIVAQFTNRLAEYINRHFETLLGFKIRYRRNASVEDKATTKAWRDLVKQIKTDVLNNTLSTASSTLLASPMEYQELVYEMRHQFLSPAALNIDTTLTSEQQYKNSIPYQLKVAPLSFFPGFLRLHQALGGKFRALPLRESGIPNNITIDTDALSLPSSQDRSRLFSTSSL
jgi:hypothetical protein